MGIVGEAGRVEVRLRLGKKFEVEMRPVRVQRDRQAPSQWVQGP